MEFSVNPSRFDPYKGFKFRVKWDGRYVAGLSRCSALRRTTEVVKHRDGGSPSAERKSPGRTSFDAITLERGVTHDPEFENWANKVWMFGAALGSEVSLRDFRKDIVIELLNEAGQLVLAYHVYRCWVSEYVALPKLDANRGKVAIQRIRLENEGWLRDANVYEPREPAFSGDEQSTWHPQVGPGATPAAKKRAGGKKGAAKRTGPAKRASGPR
jgi:phage tail-like protein